MISHSLLQRSSSLSLPSSHSSPGSSWPSPQTPAPSVVEGVESSVVPVVVGSPVVDPPVVSVDVDPVDGPVWVDEADSVSESVATVSVEVMLTVSELAVVSAAVSFPVTELAVALCVPQTDGPPSQGEAMGLQPRSSKPMPVPIRVTLDVTLCFFIVFDT